MCLPCAGDTALSHRDRALLCGVDTAVEKADPWADLLNLFLRFSSL